MRANLTAVAFGLAFWMNPALVAAQAPRPGTAPQVQPGVDAGHAARGAEGVRRTEVLFEGAAKRSNVDVKDATEWVLDTKNQRYVRIQRPPAATAPTPQR